MRSLRFAAVLFLLLSGILAAPPAAFPASYQVCHGDTLYSIARHYGITPQALIAANRLSHPGRLKPGQRLILPGFAAPTTSSVAPMARAAPPPPSPPPISVLPPVAPPAVPEEEGSASAQPYLFIVGKVKELIDSAAVQRGRWRYIVFHHSGTPSGNAKIFDYYHRYVRGMPNGLAYHFVIGNGNGSGDGQIEVGDRWLQQLQGGHLHSDALNQIAIGVCFVGDFDNTQPTKKQIAAGIELVTYLRQMCGPPTLIFKAHREINPRPTDCPGKLFPVAAFHQLFDNTE